VPAGLGRKPENICGQVFVAIFGGFGALRFLLDKPFALGVRKTEKQLFAFLLEGVRNVFKEDEAEAYVLVFRGVHMPAQLVCGGPKLRLEIKV